MTTKLQLYKKAALHLGATPPSSLAEATEARRTFDVHYDDVLKWMMEQGYWRSAMRTVTITENTGVTENFGYAYAHDIPLDFVRPYVVSASETLDPPLDDYTDGTAYLMEQGYIWADVTPLYMRYVSNDGSFGYDLTKWTDKMAEAASLEMARRSCRKLTGSASMKEELLSEMRGALGEARTHAALDQPTKSHRQGRWTTARFAGNSGEYNRA